MSPSLAKRVKVVGQDMISITFHALPDSPTKDRNPEVSKREKEIVSWSSRSIATIQDVIKRGIKRPFVLDDVSDRKEETMKNTIDPFPSLT